LSYFNYLKRLLSQAIDELSASPSDFAVVPGKDFTRNRKLGFKDMIQMLLTMEGDCIQEELYRFFGRNDDAPTKAAFCKQRQKLSDKALPTLFNVFNSKLPVSLYRGKYRLFACDGSTAEIFRDPNDGKTFFNPSKASSNGFNLIYINAMYSILDNRFVDLVLQPGRFMNEFVAFCSMVDAIGSSGPPVIYFGDMGYASYNNFAHVIENDQYFVIRSNDRTLCGILGRPVDDLREMDFHVDLVMSRSTSVKRILDPEPGTRYKHLAYTSTFDYFDASDLRSMYRMSLRVIRFEIEEGKFENIITNLPDHEFDFEDFKALYFLRWNEETAYRNLKYPLCLSAFHSKKYRNVVQEIWARAILYNFSTAIISNTAVEKKNRLHQYQVNFSEAFKTCREFLRPRGSGPEIDVASLIAKNVEAIRPGRSFARQRGIKFRRPFSFCYRN
jgi:hypothetical protein